MKWNTKDGREIEITKMSTSHIKNTLMMLKRNGYVSTKEYFDNISLLPNFQGEMAQFEAEREWDYYLEHTKPTKYIKLFKDELNRRK